MLWQHLEYVGSDSSGLTLALHTLNPNKLRSFPSDPFLASTGNVSAEFSTEITPAGWTFAIWTLIYIFLALTLVFALSGFCRK